MGTKRIEGYTHTVSYENTDFLKHLTAFHNPGNLNPEGMLNLILDRCRREHAAAAKNVV